MLVCELLSCQVEFKPSDLLFILRQGDLPESWEESNFQQTSMALESPPDVITVMYVDDATENVSDNDIINLLTRTQKKKWTGPLTGYCFYVPAS